MRCQSFDKEVQCPAPATVEVFWPGRTTAACDRHHQGMIRIANAMGFSVDSRPLPVTEASTGGSGGSVSPEGTSIQRATGDEDAGTSRGNL